MLADEVRENGFAVVPGVLSPDDVVYYREALSHISEITGIRQRGGRTYAVRNLLKLSPEVFDLAIRADIRALATEVLGAEPRPVRAILFDKTPGANWKVPWHQDVTIAVTGKIDDPEWGPWTIKAGVPHVQPPASILEAMVSIRISLDAAGAENGALLVIPGTHRNGRLRDEGIAALRETAKSVVCEVPSGGALLMKPLLLHASSPSESPHHRRVIHIDYAAATLPVGLEWAD